jgi:hypothetical protein
MEEYCMLLKIEYSMVDRESIIDEYSHLYLVMEENISEGNFRTFSDVPIEKEVIYVNVPEKVFTNLKEENTLLKAQTQANADRADFHEEVLTEIILAINQ